MLVGRYSKQREPSPQYSKMIKCHEEPPQPEKCSISRVIPSKLSSVPYRMGCVVEGSSVSLVNVTVVSSLWLFVTERFVFLFSSLAEVNTLSSDDGPLRWVPVIESVIPIVIHKKKVISMLNVNLHLLFVSTKIKSVNHSGGVVIRDVHMTVLNQSKLNANMHTCS